METLTPVHKILLSSYQAKFLLAALQQKQSFVYVSLDLGRTTETVEIKDSSFLFPGGQKLKIDDIKKVIKHDTAVYMVEDHSIRKVHFFNTERNLFYKLYPVAADKPTTFDISGINMHAIKDTDPWTDSKKKLEAIAAIHGKVLDTCMGLGYTAMFSAKEADSVVTCERDVHVIELARINPWSRELFDGAKEGKIEILNMSSFDYVQKCGDETFDVVIHDPPRPNFARELYSNAFYAEVLRVLKRGGKFYHYTGTPFASMQKRNLADEIARRLTSLGFAGVVKVYGGLLAKKQNTKTPQRSSDVITRAQ
ncbi:methyltransferase [Candidatus Woesearchaeota archaeon]|nr:methyltransferase [Candidatus Woesearchaeota archaeon]